MTLGEVREVIHNETELVVFDREADETVAEGKNYVVRTTWDDREVVWVRPYNQALYIEIE